jgi:uncharacterized membrane protein HdeD (DUF308 family)
MSHYLQTDHGVTVTTAPRGTDELRRLYFARFGFAAVWAGLLVVTASSLTPISVALLVLYPLFDLAAAVFDFRSSGATRPRGPLVVNMALSALAAIALSVAVLSGVPDVLRVWGVWAITAGSVQVLVAIRRSRLGGQRVLVVSGGISVIAGSAFIVAAAGPDPSLAGLAGYATLGGVFFLVSAVRLRRAATTTQR